LFPFSCEIDDDTFELLLRERDYKEEFFII